MLKPMQLFSCSIWGRERKSYTETSWERQVEEQEIKEQQCCAVPIITIPVRTSDITSHSQARS